MNKQNEALKLALELLAVATYYSPDLQQKRSEVINAGLKALSEQPAQQQEPYGWKVYGVNSLFMGEFAEADAKAEAKRIGGTCITFPLYTSPPASKPWVGLTPEQRAIIAEANNMLVDDDLFDAIEAKLQEKNA